MLHTCFLLSVPVGSRKLGFTDLRTLTTEYSAPDTLFFQTSFLIFNSKSVIKALRILCKFTSSVCDSTYLLRPQVSSLKSDVYS